MARAFPEKGSVRGQAKASAGKQLLRIASITCIHLTDEFYPSLHKPAEQHNTHKSRISIF